MSGTEVSLALSVFLACAVEMVEALTIVLGVGTVRGWRSVLIGVGAAAVVLAILTAALGPALQKIPIDDIRLLVMVEDGKDPLPIARDSGCRLGILAMIFGREAAFADFDLLQQFAVGAIEDHQRMNLLGFIGRDPSWPAR